MKLQKLISASDLEIRFEGFVPDHALSEIVHSTLQRIVDAAPSDAVLRVNISSLYATSEFRVSISMRTAMQRLLFEKTNRCARVALESADIEVRNTIEAWHGSRFEEIVLDEAPVQKFKHNILIVDDDPFSTRLLDNCFKFLGCTTKKVATAQAALFELMNGKKHYDLIVMDWNLTEMNGGQLVQLVDFMIGTGTSSPRRRPILAYTGAAKDTLRFPKYENFDVVSTVDKMTGYPALLSAARNVVSGIPKSTVAA